MKSLMHFIITSTVSCNEVHLADFGRLIYADFRSLSSLLHLLSLDISKIESKSPASDLKL